MYVVVIGLFGIMFIIMFVFLIVEIQWIVFQIVFSLGVGMGLFLDFNIILWVSFGLVDLMEVIVVIMFFLWFWCSYSIIGCLLFFDGVYFKVVEGGIFGNFGGIFGVRLYGIG